MCICRRNNFHLCAGNARHLQALLAAATKLGAFLRPQAAAGAGGRSGAASEARAMTVNDFLFAAGLDHVNLFSLIRWGCCDLASRLYQVLPVQ